MICTIGRQVDHLGGSVVWYLVGRLEQVAKGLWCVVLEQVDGFCARRCCIADTLCMGIDAVDQVFVFEISIACLARARARTRTIKRVQ